MTRANGLALQTFTAFDLQRMEFPPLQFVVPGYVVEGLTMIAGKPKIGKSWGGVLDVALAVAYGGYAFGTIQCEVGDVLYCALEDNKRRLRRRLNKLLPHGEWPDRLTMVTALPRIGQGCIEALQEWANGVEKPRLIVIEAAKEASGSRIRFRLRCHGPTASSRGRAGHRHHRRASRQQARDERRSPRLGIRAPPASLAEPTLCSCSTAPPMAPPYGGRGRDIEDIDVAVEFEPSTARWKILGDTDEVRRHDSRKAIITALRDAKRPLGPNAIATITTLSRENVRFLLGKMVKDNESRRPQEGNTKPHEPLNLPLTSLTNSQSPSM